jgi:TIR domain-containing protein
VESDAEIPNKLYVILHVVLASVSCYYQMPTLFVQPAGLTMVDERRLRVFISYSSEDRVLATNIADELRRAFGAVALKVDIDVEFSLGVNWRARLEDDLNKADILLVVATGREKVSHSFTGFEVGFFSSSKNSNPKMPNFPAQDRFVIPLAIFTKTPETVADIQSLQLDDPVIVDPIYLRDQATHLDSAAVRKHPVCRLFKRIQSILNTGFNDQELENSNSQIQECAGRLIDIIHDQLKQRVFHENFPERKIIVRTPLPERGSSPDQPLSRASIEFFGRFDSFGFETPRSGALPWSDFAGAITDSDIAQSWTNSVQMLVSAALRGDFRDNRQTVTTRDKDRAFRMFVARSIIYYSAVHEIHIYIVEIRYKDYGDSTTTMLLKAISLGLQYRFMFLEGRTSDFSPETLNATLPDQLRAKVAEMMQQLNYLLWYSSDAGLTKPESILIILGEDLKHAELSDKLAKWEEAKTSLYSAAQKLLSSSDDQAPLRNQGEFVTVLQNFCDNTRVMNQEFTSKVKLALENIVSKGDTIGHVEKAA